MSLHPRDAVIVDYARSAMGRSKNGCFRHVRADDISAAIIKGLLARNEQLDPATIDDLLWVCVAPPCLPCIRLRRISALVWVMFT